MSSSSSKSKSKSSSKSMSMSSSWSWASRLLVELVVAAFVLIGSEAFGLLSLDQLGIVLGRVKAGAASRLRCAQALTRPPRDAGGAFIERKELLMTRFVIPDGGELRIYPVILETIALLKNDMETIGRRDPDLANQMRRAAASIALNVSEGTYSRGRNRQVRYHTALGSARETLACIEVGVALGYVPGVREDLRERMRHILGTLTKLTR